MLRSVRPNAWKLRYGRVTVYRDGDVLRLLSLGIVECTVAEYGSCNRWELCCMGVAVCVNCGEWVS